MGIISQTKVNEVCVNFTDQVVEIAENVDTEESGTDCKNIEVELVIGKNTQVTDT